MREGPEDRQPANRRQGRDGGDEVGIQGAVQEPALPDPAYQWMPGGTPKKPFFIHRQNNEPLAFAGLWERWCQDGEVIDYCTIIATDDNELMQPIHNPCR